MTLFMLMGAAGSEPDVDGDVVNELVVGLVDLADDILDDESKRR